MSDIITINRIALMHPKLREESTSIYGEICSVLTSDVFCRFTHTLRTFAEQNTLYAQGRTKSGTIVTKAKAGLSPHNYGLAIDICLINKGAVEYDITKDYDQDGHPDWMEVVGIFKQFGWEWGGDWRFRDAPHFQKMFGKSVRDLLALHQANKVDKNGYPLF